jgi:hypothetical protein
MSELKDELPEGGFQFHTASLTTPTSFLTDKVLKQNAKYLSIGPYISFWMKGASSLNSVNADTFQSGNIFLPASYLNPKY